MTPRLSLCSAATLLHFDVHLSKQTSERQPGLCSYQFGPTPSLTLTEAQKLSPEASSSTVVVHPPADKARKPRYLPTITLGFYIEAEDINKKPVGTDKEAVVFVGDIKAAR